MFVFCNPEAEVLDKLLLDLFDEFLFLSIGEVIRYGEDTVTVRLRDADNVVHGGISSSDASFVRPHEEREVQDSQIIPVTGSRMKDFVTRVRSMYPFRVEEQRYHRLLVQWRVYRAFVEEVPWQTLQICEEILAVIEEAIRTITADINRLGL